MINRNTYADNLLGYVTDVAGALPLQVDDEALTVDVAGSREMRKM